MPYYVYAVKPFAQLEKMAEFAAFKEASTHAKVLRQATQADAAVGASQMSAAMRADLFDIDCAFYIAGPAVFVDALCAELSAAGVPRSQIHAEVMA